ncbi:ABC-2 type transport system ATP-binding protein [Virgibacillus natechei]|uniref:ABC-2 type transport system ATP-binding protein n=1 Tax=Virgibacillus natechei TaxID=1216297 RepID=A0ABS4IC10_9BACI|nr:ABC transporter ATP-binding protein [Virgibacillus natechei]MBP1968430.1 ABC-2 type transport system ATP-binding protein [Virgibacillus natechei]UZD13553.1 ABC transporter ATP-binding protein [Virgibacillus natechei]
MLTVNNIQKHYGGGTQALKNISLTIPDGIACGLVGPNGAGKSTLMKILASVIKDYKGEVHIGATTIDRKKKEQFGYIPQEICLEQTLSALDNLYFFGKLYGLKGKQLKTRASEVLADIGLSGRGNDKVITFSGGMKRRLNIGCALMHTPKIIIMDEPTIGIDPQSRRYIFQMIEQLKQKGCTIIYASHYMEEVEQLCDEVAFIDQGDIIENGSIEGLLQKNIFPSIFIKGINSLPENIRQFGTLENKDGGYLLATRTPLEAMEAVLNHCQRKNVQLEQLELVQPRLEDVFFSLTGSQLRD